MYNPGPFKGEAQNFFQNNSISIEIWLQPETVSTQHITEFFSIYDGKGVELITLSQWKSHLEITRNRLISTGKCEWDNELYLQNALPAGKSQFITVSSGTEGTAVYLNGEFLKSFPKYFLVPETGVTDAKLILGNSPTGHFPFNGNIFGLAMHNRTLSKEEVFYNYETWLQHGSPITSENKGPVFLYLFDEHNGSLAHNRAAYRSDLLLPATFHVIHKNIFSLPWNDFELHFRFFADIIINMAGFIPFGIIFSAFLFKVKKYSTGSSYIITILLGGGISLAIELIQIYLPTRSSSLTDLIFNILGTITGVIIFNAKLRQKIERLG